MRDHLQYRSVGPSCQKVSCRYAQPTRPATRLLSSMPSASPSATSLAYRSVWSITQQGSLANLTLKQEPMPQLKPGEASVAVKAVGLNFADVFCCLGLYNAAPPGEFTPGLEFAGEVIDVHPLQEHPSSAQQDSAPVRKGDRVVGVTRFGAFASHIDLDIRYLRPIPAEWSYAEAASFPVQTLTAAYGLFACGALREGATVLVQSAAGGVGLQALQILQKMRCNALGLVGSEEKVDLLQRKYSSSSGGGRSPAPGSRSSAAASPGPAATGAAAPGGWQFRVRQTDRAAIQAQLSAFLSTNKLQGFDTILDSVAGPYFQSAYDALKPCGRHVIFGAAALTPPPGASLVRGWGLLAPWNLWTAAKLLLAWAQRPKLDVLAMPGHNKGVFGFNLIWLYDQVDLLLGLYDQVEQLQLDAPYVGREFGWEQLPEALAYLQSGKSVGKVVVCISD